MSGSVEEREWARKRGCRNVISDKGKYCLMMKSEFKGGSNGRLRLGEMEGQYKISTVISF